MAVHSEIEAFFADYVDAFARADADRVGALWDEVGLFPSPSGNFAMEKQAFRDHCVTLMSFYKAQGVAQPVGTLISTAELFPNVVEARVAYRMLGDGGQAIAEWEHVYILRRTDRWRVSLTIADGEIAAWAARGAGGLG